MLSDTRKKQLNKIAKILLFESIIFTLTACGSKEKFNGSIPSGSMDGSPILNDNGEGASGEQEQITLRIVGGQDRVMELLVSEFNKEQSTYYVTYENLNEGKPLSSISETYARINAELMSDNAPDILNFYYADWGNYKDSGIFADLTPYINQDDEIQLSDYLQNVIGAYQIGGATYCIPVEFMLQAQIGSTFSVGSGSGWTIDEYLSFLEKYPETALEWYGSKNEILYNCLMFNLNEFIDFDAGISHLKDQEFREIVQRIANIPLVYANQGEEEYQTILKEGGSTLTECFWHESKEFLKKDTEYYGQMSYKGYPDESGKFMARLFPDGCVGIVATGKHQDAAWKFVKYYINHYCEIKQRTLSCRIFSSKKSEMEDTMKVLRAEIYQEEEDGTRNLLPIARSKSGELIYPLTEEELQYYRDIIDNARVLTPEEDTFALWISKEISPYYGNQKSLDAVIDSAHRKIQLYLDERK